MLHTVMPLELVMEERQGAQDTSFETTYLGRRVVCRAGPSGQMEVVRLLSTDPQDYLDPRLCPGAVIHSP
jgi:hypothetical protein